MENSIDWQRCIDSAAGKTSLALEILHCILAELPDYHNNIEKAYNNNKLSDLRMHTHKLHGACCYSGLPRVHQAAYDIEFALDQGQTELNNEVDELLEAITELQAYGPTFLATQRSA